MSRLFLLFICLLLPTGSAWAERDAAKGKKLVKSWHCKDCHGISGNAQPLITGVRYPRTVANVKWRKREQIDRNQTAKGDQGGA